LSRIGPKPAPEILEGDLHLDPLHHKGERGAPEALTGGLSAVTEGVAGVVESYPYGRLRAIHMNRRPYTRNPAVEGGVSVSLRSRSCKVDGLGNDGAECKENLPHHSD